jgi:hypothetical protein
VLGTAVATAAAGLFFALFGLESLGDLTNPYLGILVFIAVPLLFAAGLFLIPIGAWWARRRKRADPQLQSDWPVIDLRDAHQRSVASIVLLLTIANVLIVSMAAYGGVHYNIARRLEAFYAGRTDADARLVARAVAAAQDVWSRNVFPDMKVSWGTYPNYLGHVDAPGCFRCHDDEHKASDGNVIRQDCDLCHAIE